MKKAFLFLSFLAYTFAFAQYVASDEEVYIASTNYAQSYMNIQNPDISFSYFPSQSKPLYEISLGNGQTLLVSSQKIATPILAIIENPIQMPILGNPNLPDGLQYMIDKFCDQIFHAMDSREHTIHPHWNDLLSDVQGGTLNNRIVYGPYLTTAWGQDRPNDTPWEAAFNYYVETTDNSCQGGDMGHKCPTGCVATAMAQIMRYWNYPVFRYGHELQYDWCNMPNSLTTYLQPTTMLNPYYEKQRNAIARLMADCGEAADMHYCCHNFIIPNHCESFAWPINARNALVDSFQYSSDAIRRLRSDYLTQPDTWKNFLIQDLQNGRPLIYAGASYATGGYEQSGHAFVCDGYNEGTDLFHFNWGDLSDGAWCALDAIIDTDFNHNYNHLERAVFNIHPSTNENYCDFDLELFMHYLMYYNPFVTTPPPYQNVPPTATRLYSVPISVPNGSGTYYFDDSLRTIPSGATSEYVAHKEVVLRPGFTAENGCDFVARIEPCAECEEERGQNHPMEVTNATPRMGMPLRVPTNGTLRLHPNPTTHTLTVETSSSIRTLTVYDLAGRVMMTVEGGDAISVMDVSSLPNGIYLLRVVSDSGVQTGRFVKN